METENPSSPALPNPFWWRWMPLGYLVFYAFPWLFNRPDALQLAYSALAVAVFLPLYAFLSQCRWDEISDRDISRWQPWRIAAILALAVLAFAARAGGGSSFTFTLYAIAFATALRPTRTALLLSAIIVVMTVVFILWLHLRWTEWVWLPPMAMMIAFSQMAVGAIEDRNRRIVATQSTARRMAVIAERERIGRDLHDLLGHTMTAVIVKAELAAKLMDRGDARASREITEIRDTARAALAEIRQAVSGMQSTTLMAAAAQARQVLESAGVDLQFSGPAEPLPENVESVLAQVVREGTTNVVRHAHATRCEIRVARSAGTVSLEMRDNGTVATQAPIPGNGLRGLRARVAALQGSLELARGTAEDGSGYTSLLVKVPA